MNNYHFVTNALNHLIDFEQDFGQVILVLKLEEAKWLSNHLNQVLSLYFPAGESGEMSPQQLLSLTEQVMSEIIRYSALVQELNINLENWQQSGQSRLSKEKLSQIKLANSEVFQKQERETEQLRKLENDTYRVITSLQVCLTNYVKG